MAALRETFEPLRADEIFGGVAGELRDSIEQVARTQAVSQRVVFRDPSQRARIIFRVDVLPHRPRFFEQHLKVRIAFVAEARHDSKAAAFGQHLQTARSEIRDVCEMKQPRSRRERSGEVRTFDVQQAVRREQFVDVLKCSARRPEVLDDMNEQDYVVLLSRRQFKEVAVLHVGSKLLVRESLKAFAGIDPRRAMAVEFKGFDVATDSGSDLKDGILGTDERLQPVINSLSVHPSSTHTARGRGFLTVIRLAVLARVELLQFGLGRPLPMRNHAAPPTDAGVERLAMTVERGEQFAIQTAAQVARIIRVRRAVSEQLSGHNANSFGMRRANARSLISVDPSRIVPADCDQEAAI